MAATEAVKPDDGSHEKPDGDSRGAQKSLGFEAEASTHAPGWIKWQIYTGNEGEKALL